MQSKLDLWEPTIISGIYGWLMGYRLLAAKFARARAAAAAVGRRRWALAVAVLTALGEAVYFWLAFPRVPILAGVRRRTGRW